MPATDGTCEYLLDPDDPETWGGEDGDECYVDKGVLNEDGVWTCPHGAEVSEDFCIFHLPPEHKNDEEVIDRLLQTIEQAVDLEAGETEEHQLQFLCSKFGDFDISNKSEYMESTYVFAPDEKIDLSYSDFTGRADLSGVVFNISNILFNGAVFRDIVDFSRSEIEGDIHVMGAEFHSEAYFRDSVFHKSAIFRGSQFDRVTFSSVEFRQDADFHNAIFSSQTVFASSSFQGLVNFSDVVFEYDDKTLGAELREETDIGQRKFEMIDFFNVSFSGSANFMRAEFRNVTQMNNMDCAGSIDFSRSEFFRDTRFWNAYFSPGSKFRNVEFNSDVSFIEAEFDSVVLSGAEFYRGVDARNSTFTDSDFNNADLSGGNFSGSNITECDFESAILSQTILFDADIRGARLSGALLGDVRIDEDTKFLGHPSDDSDASPHTFAAIRSQQTCVYDPVYDGDNEHEDMDKAKSVYRALEELGGKHARPRLQARSFVRRQDLQKKGYWDDATADDASLEERLIAGARWSRARVGRATLLYGESPWRVIAWSLGIIFSFALLYPLGGWMQAEGASEPLSYSQIPVSILSEPLGWLSGFVNILADAVYYSTLTYTALGFGDFQPEGLGRLLTTVETGLGAVMLALLVFILGRRAAR